MKPILRMIVCVSIALTSSCTHIPESAAHSEVYLRWVAEIRKKRQDPMNIRVAGYNSAIVLGRIATIVTNELSNEVIAKSLTLDSPSILLSEFRVCERKITFLFSTPTVFDNILPSIGETWVIYAHTNAKGHWFVHEATRIEEGSTKLSTATE